MNELQPARIPLAQMQVESETPSFRVARLVERGQAGSELVLGLCWMDPDGDAVSWSADAETHEAYFVIAGSVRVRWNGPGAGNEELGPQDAFFFPPAFDYTIENVGTEQAFLVWALTPAPRG
jgi:mannose-6-phosphate isomerase-like protein (cupin superfamily)